MSWIWAPVFLVIGAMVGAVIVSIVAYDNVEHHDGKRGRDDE